MHNPTPGPWFMRLSDNATPHIMHGKDPLHGGIPEIDELANLICVMPAEIMQSFNSFANARLIAAAPELLAMLIEVLDKVPLTDSTRDAVPTAAKARAVIAKATGRPE